MNEFDKDKRDDGFTPVLYSTGCPACRTLKDILDSRGITYTENNNVERMLSLGFDKVPMLEVEEGLYLDYAAGMSWAFNGGKRNEEQ